MSIWALSDLHLSFSTPEKTMEVFGPPWKDYEKKIQQQWLEVIHQDDLVLLPGDISWAKNPEEALIDLKWLDALPGTKVMIKGNHDYWWRSNQKLKKILPPSLHFIHNTAFHWKDVAVAGTRLWDTTEYSFDHLISFEQNPYEKPHEKEMVHIEEIYDRELVRLENSLKQMNPDAKVRIAITHYPPISADLKSSRASNLLEDYHIQFCVFGHLHNVIKDIPIFGEKNGIVYLFTSCDYLNFKPLLISPT